MLSESITCDNIMSENSHLHEAPAILFWDSVQASFFILLKKKRKILYRWRSTCTVHTQNSAQTSFCFYFCENSWECVADVGRIGIGICHDIRFPELAMLYRSRGTSRHFFFDAVLDPLQIPWTAQQVSASLPVTCHTRCTPDMLSFCIQHEHWGAPVGPHAEIQVPLPHFQPGS